MFYFPSCFRGFVALVCLVCSASLFAADIPQIAGLKPVFGETGDTIGFYAEAFGTEPFEYQWMKDGEELVGRTDRDLVFGALSANDAGSYKLVVSNDFGKTETNEARVTLIDGYSEALDLEGVEWSYDGTHPFIVDSDEGYEGGTALVSYPKSDFQLSDSVLEAEIEGPGTLVMKLRQESVDGFREPVIVKLDNSYLGSRLWPDDDWRQFGVWIPEGVHKVRLEYDVSAYAEVSSMFSSELPPSHGTKTWLDSFRFDRAPFILEQSNSVVGSVGESRSLSVVATGVGDLLYQWYNDGVPIEGETGAVLEIQSLSDASEGMYHVEIVNDYGSAASEEIRVVSVDDWRLLVASETISQGLSEARSWDLELGGTAFDEGELVYTGGSEKLEIVVTGPTQFLFDWKTEQFEVGAGFELKLGSSLVWRSNYTFQSKPGLVLPEWSTEVIQIPEGEHVLSWTFEGEWKSHPGRARALLKKFRKTDSPVIVTQPRDRSFIAGETVGLEVYALGAEPLSYRWFKDGEVLPEENEDGFLIEVGTAANAGEYTCLIEDAAGGSILSRSAKLEVKDGFHAALGVAGGHFVETLSAYRGSAYLEGGQLVVPTGLNYYFDDSIPQKSMVRVKLRVEGVDGDPASVRLGEMVREIGNSDWVYLEFPMVGDHLRFSINHRFYDGIYFRGEPVNENARVIVDSISILGAPIVVDAPVSIDAVLGTPIGIEVSVLSTSEFQYKWQRNGVDYASGNADSDVELIVLPLGIVTVDTVGEYRLSVFNELGESHSRPIYVNSGNDLGDSVGVPNSLLSTSGQRLWSSDTTDSMVGQSSLSTTNLGKGEEASLFLEARGPSVLSYGEKSEANGSGGFFVPDLRVYVDGVQIDARKVGVSAGWTKRAIDLGRGDHVVEWRVVNVSSDRIKYLLDGIRIEYEEAETFGVWAFREVPFPVFALYDDEAALRLGDQDGDSRPNFVEYLLGSDPMVFDREPRFSLYEHEGRWGVSVALPWRSEARDAEIGLEVSYDLKTWFPVPASRQITGSGSVEIMDFSYGSLVSEMPMPSFARVRYYNLDDRE